MQIECDVALIIWYKNYSPNNKGVIMYEYISTFVCRFRSHVNTITYRWWEFAGEHAMALVIFQTAIWLILAAILFYVAFVVLFPVLMNPQFLG